MKIFIFLILTLLASCSSTQQLYEGEQLPDEQIAYIQTVEAGFFKSFGRSMIRDWATTSTNPDDIEIEGVNGQPVKKNKVTVLPGPQRVQASASLVISNGFATWHQVKEGLLKFDARAGHRYGLGAVPSENSPPWHFEIRDLSNDNVIATTAPKLEELLVPQCNGLDAWERDRWVIGEGVHFTSFRPTGETEDEWTQFVELWRYQGEPTSGDFQSLMEADVMKKRKAKIDVELTVEGNTGVMYWSKQPSEYYTKRKGQWGVTVSKQADGHLNSMVYTGQLPVNETIRSEWEARFKAARMPAAVPQ